MKFSKKRLSIIKKIAFLGAIFLVIFVIGYYTGFFRENCGQDKTCFVNNANKCASAEYFQISTNNVYHYVVYPGVSDTCHINIILERVNAGAQPELRNLEGKSMRCALRKDGMADISVTDFDQYMDKCTGPLKEGVYEILVQRMYGTLISNLGEITRQSKTALGK